MGRVNPTAFQKKKVQARIKKKYGRVVCEHCKKKTRGVPLQYAHKNRRNYETTSTNLILLCPNCHAKYDRKVVVRVHGGGWGPTRVTRVKRRKPKKKKKKQRVGETIVKSLKIGGKIRKVKVTKVSSGEYRKKLVKPKRKVKKRRSSGWGW